MAIAAAAAGLAVGFALTLLAVRRPPPALLRQRHLRTNYRGVEVPGTLGVLLVIPACTGGGLAVGAALLGWNAQTWTQARPGVVVAAAAVAMGVLGFLDDLYGSAQTRGFAGHMRALVRGRVTTGAIKALGGGIVGLAAAWVLGHRGIGLVIATGIVALSANLANLLDLRPGRTAKVWLLAWTASLLAGPPVTALTASSALAGGVIGWLPTDLSERGMLGDAGANMLGAAAGTLAIVSLGPAAQLACLAVLLALTAASEAVSFTQVIERFPPLRALDALGRRPVAGGPDQGSVGTGT